TVVRPYRKRDASGKADGVTAVPDAIHPFDSATAMLRALARRRVSALELLEWQQRRIERYNGELNVIVAQDLDAARRAARRADQARARGAKGRLLGLP